MVSFSADLNVLKLPTLKTVDDRAAPVRPPPRPPAARARRAAIAMGLRAIADADPDGVCQRLLDECDFETTTEAELEALVREQLALLEVGDPGCAWIGLRAALRVPSGWIRYRTHEGDLYYLRDGTEDSQWAHPLEPELRALYARARSRGLAA